MADTDRFHEQEDDGYVVADMSGIEQTPLLIPRPGAARARRRETFPENAESSGREEPLPQLDRGERNAMIRGAVSAFLLVGGVIAAAFALLIFLIGQAV